MSIDHHPETVPGLVADPPDAAQLPESAQVLLMATSKWVSQSLYAAAKLGIADLLVDGPRPVEDLARDSGTHARSLHRVLRAIASVGVFAEDEHGRFAQTPLSTWLRADLPGSIRDAVIFFGEDFTWRPYGSIVETVRTGRPAFNRINDVPDMFTWFADHPESQAIFDNAMLALSGDSIPDVAAYFDFSRFSTVVDIGGGQGRLVSEIAKANPGTRAVLFDQESVVAGAPATLEANGVQDRVDCVGGNFFESVPAGGDAYILKSVLHDWDDDVCVDILSRVRAVLPQHGRLLVIEAVLPPLNAWDFAKFMDVEMMVNVGGVERTEQDWRAVLEASGLELEEIVPISPPNSILVARPR